MLVPSPFVLASSTRQFQVRDRLSFRVSSFSRLRPGLPSVGSARDGAVCRVAPVGAVAALLGPLAELDNVSLVVAPVVSALGGSRAVSRTSC